MIDRYDPHFDQDDRFEMRKVLFPAPTEGVWVRWEDHIESVCKYRDKLLELAKQCEPCGGTGMITVEPGFTAAFGRVVPCNACEDLRELTA